MRVARRTRSTRNLLTIATLAAACWLAPLAPLDAHELRRGLLVFPSGTPVTGQPADVQIVIFGADDKPDILIDTTVSITADMTAHSMAPIATELRTLRSDRTLAGSIRFSMPGNWRIRVGIIEPDEDERVAVLPLTVLPSNAPPSPAPLTLNFGLDVPLRPTVFDPWTVVGTVLGLIVLLEVIAIAAYARRRRRV